MKKFVVEVTNNSEPYYEHKDRKVIISMQNYLGFIQLAKEVNIFDNLVKYINIQCEICKAFVIPIDVFYKTLKKMIDFLDNIDSKTESAALINNYDILCEVIGYLIQPVVLTDEEYLKYFENGFKGLNILSYDGIGVQTDDNGNPLTYVSQEVAFIFNKKCNCYNILTGS